MRTIKASYSPPALPNHSNWFTVTQLESMKLSESLLETFGKRHMTFLIRFKPKRMQVQGYWQLSCQPEEPENEVR